MALYWNNFWRSYEPMKKGILLILAFVSLSARAQTVFGYWYGYANVKTSGSANNYLVEMILQPDKGFVSGIINYYFKDIYRSVQVKGNYNPATRQLSLYDIPVVYHGSIRNFEVDCNMNILATLRVAQAGSELAGSFKSLPDYQYTCPEIKLSLKLNADISKKDSVLQAFREYKETYQVWKPGINDTLIAAEIAPRKVINYPVEKEFRERENVVQEEIEVESDSLRVDIYDNGEIDGDIISVFFNQQLILSSQKLTHKSIKINLPLDSLRAVNEISMFAENLGLIPPNTALMLINDGKNKYELRVSSNLEKNATIRIKRKKSGAKNSN